MISHDVNDYTGTVYRGAGLFAHKYALVCIQVGKLSRRSERITLARQYARSTNTQNEVWVTNLILGESGEKPVLLNDVWMKRPVVVLADPGVGVVLWDGQTGR